MARRRIYSVNSSGSNELSESAHIPLDPARITHIALQLLSEIGLKELSMRKIADALGVKTASLYYHVKDKDQLLQLLADRVCEDMLWADASLPWQEQILYWGDHFRKVLQSYRNSVELFNWNYAPGYGRLTQIEKLFEVLVLAGFQDNQIPWMASMLKNFVLGFVVEELQHSVIPNVKEAQLDKQSGNHQEFYQHLPKERFPLMIRLGTYMTNSDLDNEFRFGLEVLMEGFMTKLS
ncbi:TetR family transcriptional regulator [Paenibacillus psychroresistens]|uniref:TetR family transcriptional regulator n=1 Tax=Paenibacillus psychroresistens TaxID=1778678 RepID=A0A6B8RSP3_9BACL|nr:TetR/AcrR family transcriptional regulator C-terminal domain-containing protein [Paenibacillus psychroresistens]QGQ98927.1 TetR family transcriptional regulator [Paenibacillus psychroresistens]